MLQHRSSTVRPQRALHGRHSTERVPVLIGGHAAPQVAHYPGAGELRGPYAEELIGPCSQLRRLRLALRSGI